MWSPGQESFIPCQADARFTGDELQKVELQLEPGWAWLITPQGVFILIPLHPIKNEKRCSVSPLGNFLAESSQHTYSRTRVSIPWTELDSRICNRSEFVTESGGLEPRMAGESKPSSNMPRKAVNSLPNHQQNNQALSKLATTYKTGADQPIAGNGSKLVTSPPGPGEEGSSRVSMPDPPPQQAAQSRHPSHKSASRLWKKAKVRASPVLLTALRTSE